MVKVVVDSSVIIDYLRDKGDDLLGLIDKMEEGKVKLLLPMVVVMELWSGKSMEGRQEEGKVIGLLEQIERVKMEESMAMRAGEIRRRGQVRAMDAIIAATALEEGAQLATLNRKDFERVEGLELWK